MADRRPGEGRYAQVEREQRWLVRAVPADAQEVARISDRYVIGTRLRLRRSESGSDVVFKLGQKVRAKPTDPEIVKLTNMYLTAEEFRVVAALPAALLDKTRWQARWHGRTIAIDQFHGRLDGLLLAEVELGAADARLPWPSYTVRDVTNDDRFSGGALAFPEDAVIESLLSDVRAACRPAP